MKPYVDIQGSGPLSTKITQPGSAVTNTGTLIGANNAELRDLTVESLSPGQATNTIAIYNNAASPRITNVTANGNFGINLAYGIYNVAGSAPVLTLVTANAVASGLVIATGIVNDASSPTLNNVAAAGTSSIGIGIFNTNGASPVLNEVTATGTGTGLGAGGTGIANNLASAAIRNSIITGAGPSAFNVGISNAGASGANTVTVANSQVVGNQHTVSTTAFFTTNVGATQLGGGPVSGPVTCAGVYDEAYAFSASTCP
jgi:hypothetical protein